MEFSCIAPLTPAVTVMRGLVCQPLFCSVVVSGSYLVFVGASLFEESVMVVCEFYELDGVVRGE